MISPNDFYADREHPTRNEKRSMWQTVQQSVNRSGSQSWAGLERRSFLFGMAAAVVLMFASVGAYTTARNAIHLSQPAAIQIDRAYETAINEFERVAMRTTPDVLTSDPGPELAQARREQLEILETAIEALRDETNSRDISPLMRSRLRDLYSKKLALLQIMVEQGDITL